MTPKVKQQIDQARTAHRQQTGKATRQARHKFGAKPTEVDGVRFSSKLEAGYFKHLRRLESIGEVSFFLRQVPFHLPGGVRLVVDFQVFWMSGDVQFIDTKGVETESFRAKKRQVEALFPVRIDLVKKVPTQRTEIRLERAQG